MVNNQKPGDMIRSDYSDIMVKVDTDVYHLDRLQLALKSDYFEKLFTEDFLEKRCDLIELPLMDSDTFSAIVDVIYGKDLKSVITSENCISLLMAMDYLQMGIDLKVFANFIKEKAGDELLSDANIFKLYNFILENENFKALLPSVFEYLGSHLKEVRGYEEFQSLALEQFVEIILAGKLPWGIERMHEFSEICVEWICYDWENRLPHIFKIVNAAKYNLCFPCTVNDEKLHINLLNMSQVMKREKVLGYFQRLLLYKGENNIVPGKFKSISKEKDEDFHHDSHDKNAQNKLVRFLENGTLYDITVKVEEKTYRLHRFKLKSSCGYFAELFSTELSAETSEQSEGTSAPTVQSNKDKEYLLSDIDHTIFEMMIDYIYLDKEVQLTSDNIVGILKADSILQIKGLQPKCESWLKNNMEEISTDLAIEILNFTCGKVKLENLLKLYFRKFVPLMWPEIGDNVTLFRSVSFNMLEEILLSETLHFYTIREWTPDFYIDDQHKLLDICTKWIIHDAKNRYHLIPRVALAINCNFMVDYDDYKMETPADFNNCSQQQVRDELWKILCSTTLVPSNIPSQNTTRKRKLEENPVFISSTIDKKIHILNAELNNVASLPYFEGKSFYKGSSVSATVINDNVYIIKQSECIIINSHCFQVYNLTLKKLISLCDIPKEISDSKYDFNIKCTLLNCLNGIYCCYETGYVLEYSTELNRWTRLSKYGRSSKDGVLFASDGKKLYRMYLYSKSGSGAYSLNSQYKYVVEIYNFEQNKWISSQNEPLLTNDSGSLLQLTFVNGGKLAALFKRRKLLRTRLKENRELPSHI
ncbi:BTB (POZ) domain-containing protein 8 [Sarracenia purpurea var. burkii]